jgi:hypothetical protein
MKSTDLLFSTEFRTEFAKVHNSGRCDNARLPIFNFNFNLVFRVGLVPKDVWKDSRLQNFFF